MVRPESYINAQKIALQFRDGFIGVYAQEFGSLYDYGFGHIGIIGGDSLCPVNKFNLEETYRYITSHKIVGHFHHPFESDFDDFKYDASADSCMNLLEIINKDHLFEEKFIEALNKGWHISPTANQDNHNKMWGNEVCGGRIPLTGIVMDTLSYESFMDALMNRRTYAFQETPEGDMIYLDFTVNGNQMGSIVKEEPGPVEIEVSLKADSPFDTVYIYKNGSVIYKNFSGTSDFTMTVVDTFTSSSYYFVKAVQKDGDLVYSAPVWLEHTPVLSNRIRILPNPVSEHARFEVEVPLMEEKVYIYDTMGTLIFSGNNMEWDIKDLKNRKVREGIYIVVIEGRDFNGEKHIFRDKLWVQY